MVYKKCTRTCPKYCDNSIIPKKGCTINCKKPGCECKDGYRLTHEGKCVKKKDCPKYKTTTRKPPTTRKCPKNEVYKKCRSACEPKCTDNPNKVKICTLQCLEAGCECKKGFVRDEFNDKCVKRKKCPKATTPIPRPTPVCPKNMVYSRCKSACPPKCKDKSKKNKCCTKKCAGQGCECRSPFALDKYGNCVKRKDCKKHSRKVF